MFHILDLCNLLCIIIRKLASRPLHMINTKNYSHSKVINQKELVSGNLEVKRTVTRDRLREVLHFHPKNVGD